MQIEEEEDKDIFNEPEFYESPLTEFTGNNEHEQELDEREEEDIEDNELMKELGLYEE